MFIKQHVYRTQWNNPAIDKFISLKLLWASWSNYCGLGFWHEWKYSQSHTVMWHEYFTFTFANFEWLMLQDSALKTMCSLNTSKIQSYINTKIWFFSHKCKRNNHTVDLWYNIVELQLFQLFRLKVQTQSSVCIPGSQVFALGYLTIWLRISRLISNSWLWPEFKGNNA